MNIEKFSTKLKKILCLVLCILTFNSISTFAVENNENYFLTQKHILKSRELCNFIKDTEKGIFPDISSLDEEQKKNLSLLISKLYGKKFYENYLKKNSKDMYSNKKLDLMKTYFVEYPHQKDVLYYYIGYSIVSSKIITSKYPQYITAVQEKLRDNKISPYFLYTYVRNTRAIEENISTLKENTLLTDEMIQDLLSVGYTRELPKIIADVNNNPQIKDKNKYLYNYLIAGSIQPVFLVFCNLKGEISNDAEIICFKRVMKKQKEAIDYLENSKINFSSELDDSIKIRKLIYSKNLDIDKLTREEAIVISNLISTTNSMSSNPYYKEYLIRKLLDKNINIINLAYITFHVVIDEPLKPEIEKLFDKGIINNRFLLYGAPYCISASNANSIYEKLQQSNHLTEKSLAKAINLHAITNKIHLLDGTRIQLLRACVYWFGTLVSYFITLILDTIL